MSRGNVNFETVFEKIARIMARSYGINVIIEGNTAYTDGKKIVLPMLEDVTDELRADLNGYLMRLRTVVLKSYYQSNIPALH